MNEGSKHLTKSERGVMEALWSGERLTKEEINKKMEGSPYCCWKERSIFTLLNSLMDKGLVKEAGFVRAGKGYARKFEAAVSRPEYYAELLTWNMTHDEIVTCFALAKKKIENCKGWEKRK